MIQIMKTKCLAIEQASPLHQTAFYKYLFNQFAPLVDSVFFQNGAAESQYWPLRFKHEATKSVIAISTDLSSRLYERGNAHNGNDLEESKGEEEFYLCEVWQKSKDFLYLVNQDDSGLSNLLGLISNEKFTFDLQAFNDLGFTLLSWDEQMKARHKAIATEWKVLFIDPCIHITYIWKCGGCKAKADNSKSTEIEEKDKRTELLFRIVGTKETLKTKIKVELWGMEFMPNQMKIENIDIGEFRYYVLTYDNILKMIAIYLRIQSNTPIILMGETGCGKTSLIKQDLRDIVKACVNKWEEDGKRIAMEEEEERKKKKIEEEKKENEEKNRKKREAEEKMKKMEEMKKKQSERDREQWIFLDEINTSPDIGWLNELVCNHTLDGVKIPEGIKIIAACNPYRKRKLSAEEDELLANDELSKYVYRVHPLCETMKEYVWSFGRLSELDEQQYIVEMTNQVKSELASALHGEFDRWKSEISKKIATAQKHLRVHLRDKAIMFKKYFSWLMKQGIVLNNNSIPWICRSLNIAIGLCYYFRLNIDERRKLSKELSTNIAFDKLLENEVNNLCDSFSVPGGVALNQGLKENLFILFMCI
ncbi:hypothetical protein RFI_23362, partial [Reticulomyxa filosa]